MTAIYDIIREHCVREGDGAVWRLDYPYYPHRAGIEVGAPVSFEHPAPICIIYKIFNFVSQAGEGRKVSLA